MQFSLDKEEWKSCDGDEWGTMPWTAADSAYDSISTAGASEYKLNSKVVTYKKYNETLEGFNILVKAKNFLVFQVGTTSVLSSHRADLRDRHQGDVEQVASQSPKDLAKLIDQISG